MNKKPSIRARKKARFYAVQSLYGWMLSQNDLSDIEKYVLLEHAQDNFDREYFQILLHQVPAHLTALERLIVPYLNRKLEEVGFVELTILRIGVYELKERQEIPYRVVINEALELAKTFASADSHKFINGVLDKVARELREMETSK